MFWLPDAAECMGRYAVVANGLSNSVPVPVAERAVEIISRIEGRARAEWRGPAATITLRHSQPKVAGLDYGLGQI